MEPDYSLMRLKLWEFERIFKERKEIIRGQILSGNHELFTENCHYVQNTDILIHFIKEIIEELKWHLKTR